MASVSYMGLLSRGRPDLYTSETLVAKNPKGYIPKSNTSNNLSTFIIIILSGLIFITMFSYADTLRSYLDSLFIEDIIKKQTKSRFIFAIIMTIITIIAFLIVLIVYLINKKKK